MFCIIGHLLSSPTNAQKLNNITHLFLLLYSRVHLIMRIYCIKVRVSETLISMEPIFQIKFLIVIFTCLLLTLKPILTDMFAFSLENAL